MDKPALLSTDALTIYLNDHLAGATAGVELVRRAASENEGSEFGAVLRELCAEIQHDREELIAIITGLGYPVDRAKVALGWTAEKVGRLKPNGRLRGYSPLGRLLELEGLLAGIHAKQALWRALLRTGQVDPQRLEILLTRAEEQAGSSSGCITKPPSLRLERNSSRLSRSFCVSREKRSRRRSTMRDQMPAACA